MGSNFPPKNPPVVVHAASLQDYNGARLVLAQLDHQFKRLKVIFTDSAYGRNGLPEWLRKTFGWVLQTVLRRVRNIVRSSR